MTDYFTLPSQKMLGGAMKLSCLQALGVTDRRITVKGYLEHPL